MKAHTIIFKNSVGIHDSALLCLTCNNAFFIHTMLLLLLLHVLLFETLPTGGAILKYNYSSKVQPWVMNLRGGEHNFESCDIPS